MMSWGNWDVRVYAAGSLMALARRWGDSDHRLIDRITRLLDDPHPTVRHRVSSALNTLWNTDRTAMWNLVQRVADEEADKDVLAHFAGGTLRRLISATQGQEVLEGLFRRFPVEGPGSDDGKEFERVLGELAGTSYIHLGRAQCRAHVEHWCADIAGNGARLSAVVAGLRGPLYASYVPEPSVGAAEVQERARLLLGDIVEAASAAKTEARTAWENSSDPDAKSAIQLRHHAVSALIDQCGNEIYFGSGAFRNGNQPSAPALPTNESKGRFLDEYGSLLDRIARAAEPAALHHLLETYEFLIPGAPEEVFDRLAAMLVGPAALEGYHYESLGNDAVVRIVRGYLADYRSVFEADERRRALLALLDLFAKAGWPEALRLLYELPDLLR